MNNFAPQNRRVLLQPHLLQEVEKEVQSEVVKKTEAGNVSPPQESTCSAAPLAEPEAKIEEKQIEPSAIEHVKDVDADEKPKAEESAEVAAPSAEPTEQKIEDKPVVEPEKTEVAAPSAESTEVKIEEGKKAENATTVEASDNDIKEVEKESVPELRDIATVSEPTIDVADCKTEEKSEIEPAQEKKVDLIEEKPEEPAKVVDVPESAPATVVEEEVEKGEESPAIAVPECKPEEPAPAVEEKPSEQSEVTEQVEKEPPEAEPVEKVEVEGATGSSEEFKSETAVIQVEEKDVACNPTDEVSEKMDGGNEVKEPAKETIETKGSPEAKTEEKSAVAEELVQCEEKPTEDATRSVPPPEPAEKAAEEKVTVVSAETNKEAQVEGKAEKIVETAQATEAKVEEEKQVDEKIEETEKTTEAKLEEEKQVDEAAKTDVQSPECIRDIEDTKTSLDAPKEDVPVKTQKQSIVKMVKQSLVKAKKAIIGKSHNSKTPAPEPKDDAKK